MKHIYNFRKFNEGFFGDIASGAKTSWQRTIGEYKEPIWIWIKYYENEYCFIENKGLDGEVNIKLMDILNERFDLHFIKKGKFYVGSTFEFKYSKLEEGVSDFLTGLGLNRNDFEGGFIGSEDIVFSGKLSMKDLKTKLK